LFIFIVFFNLVSSLTWEKNLESLKQGLRILILVPQIITSCKVLKRQIVLLKILLKIDGIFVFSG
uniref:Uncharacterized protein n=1 Tax=Phocoena sinus TaxID=42100 RepID=A0A8C9B9T5_PHOSS